MPSETVLVVDDEANIREIVRVYLEHEGFSVMEACDGEDALAIVEHKHPDLVVLDIMMPKVDGNEVCKRLRQRPSSPAIIMLTARNHELDKVLSLELGADDYLAKPFSPRELITRIKAVLRRTAPSVRSSKPKSFKFGDLEISPEAREAACEGASLSLTPKEFDTLWYLASAKGRVCSREILLSNVWGDDYPGGIRTVDSHVKSLREKMGPHCGAYLRTVWGVGYRFDAQQ